MYEQIRYDVDDPVATITLDRPDRLNAFTPVMGEEIRNAMGRAAADPAVVGIVLTGAGRGFCAGADLSVLQGISDGDGDGDTGGTGDGRGADRGAPVPGNTGEAAGESGSLTRPQGLEPVGEDWGADLRGTYTYLLSIPKPIIAAVNGAAAGMAVPIALSCDLRFMADTAVLTTAFSQRGLVAEWGLSWLLPRLIGPSAALDLLFSSRKVGAEECLRLGLADRCLPADEVVPAARDYIEQLARTASPTSMAVMKRQVYQQLHDGLGPAEKEAIALMLESFGRPDLAEGVASFLQKRPPRFARLGAADAGQPTAATSAGATG